ncbi:MAG: hypothetical protein JSS66_06155 [Armatimonadetes bacterium]|nr:hypothetical protein [Armatimonadota bacterium]
MKEVFSVDWEQVWLDLGSTEDVCRADPACLQFLELPERFGVTNVEERPELCGLAKYPPKEWRISRIVLVHTRRSKRADTSSVAQSCRNCAIWDKSRHGVCVLAGAFTTPVVLDDSQEFSFLFCCFAPALWTGSLLDSMLPTPLVVENEVEQAVARPRL